MVEGKITRVSGCLVTGILTIILRGGRVKMYAQVRGEVLGEEQIKTRNGDAWVLRLLQRGRRPRLVKVYSRKPFGFVQGEEIELKVEVFQGKYEIMVWANGDMEGK